MAATEIKAGRVKGGDACEAVVIGAGLVGAALVASLTAEGLDVAVLEARRTAHGPTSQVSRMVATGLPTPYAQVAEEWGRSTAQGLWELTVENRQRLLSIADRLGVAAERTGSLVLARDDAEAQLLEASSTMLAEDGLSVRFESRDPLNKGFSAALHYPDDVVVDATGLTKSLIEVNDVPLETGTEVYRLEKAGDDIAVLARGYMLRASTVVLAVNAYAPLIDAYFADKIAPISGYTMTTHPVAKQSMPIPGSSGPFTFQQDREGRLHFSAWSSRYETPPAGPGEDSTEIDMMRFVGRHFPEATGKFARRGSSLLANSKDGLPLVGALPHLPQVYFAVGFGGHGLSLAFTAADLLTGLIVRGAEPELLSARRLE